jgi:ABC-2 type transport system permease protein
MINKRVINVIRKEWRVLVADLNGTLIITLLPLVILGQALLYIWLIDKFAGDSIINNSFFKTVIDKFLLVFPSAVSLSASDQFKLLLLNQFNFYLLLIPTMIASNSASFSVFEEKMSRSLEPLLATPVKTWELLLGKAIAGVVPGLLITWVCGLIFIGGIMTMGWGNLLGNLLTPVWYVSMFLLTPSITILGFFLAVIGSSKAKTAKNAQNYALFIILPVFILIALQVTGLVWFNISLSLLLFVIIAVIDYLVLRLSVKLFQRENIVIKWQ